MSERLTILCDNDGCGRDISYTTGQEKYRLVLNNEVVQVDPETDRRTRTLMIVYPPISRKMHFCNKRCLTQWVIETEELC